MAKLNGEIKTDSVSGNISSSNQQDTTYGGVTKTSSLSATMTEKEQTNGVMSTAKRLKGSIGGGRASSAITIDTELSSTSTNPVENRVITNALYHLADDELIYSTNTSEQTIGSTSALTNDTFPYGVPEAGDLVITKRGFFGRVQSVSGNSYTILWLADYGAGSAVVSTSNDGLAPRVTNVHGFLRGDGTWVEVSGTDEKVLQTVLSNTDSGVFPVMLSPSDVESGTTDRARYSTGVTLTMPTGMLSAPYFMGNGLNLWGLNASAIDNGTLNANRLPRLAYRVVQNEVNTSSLQNIPVLLAGIPSPNGDPYETNYDDRVSVNPFTGFLNATVSGDGSHITNILPENVNGIIPISKGGTGGTSIQSAVSNLGLNVGGIVKIDENGNASLAQPSDLSDVMYNEITWQGNATTVSSFGSGVNETLPWGFLFCSLSPAGEAPKVGDSITSTNGYIGTIRAISADGVEVTWFNKFSSMTGYVTGTKLVLETN